MFKFILVILVIFLVSLPIFFTESKYYRGNISNHFNGKYFYNVSDLADDLKSDKQSNKHRGFFSYYLSKINYEKIHGKPIWQDKIITVKQFIPKDKIEDKSLHVSYIGHSTFLLQLQGLNILTDPIYSNNNPTIDASNSPNQTLMLTPNVVIGGDGNSEHWNRFNSNGTVDFLGANIKFTSGGAAAFNSSITIGSPVLLGNNVLDVIGNISASAITASRLVGTADSASYLTPTNNYTVANLTSSNILVTGTIYASNFSASTIYITSSEYIVSDNIITLNALNPHQNGNAVKLNLLDHVRNR